jgi:lipoprotein-anchoring transpeptidase ErfK/SrfK
MLRLVLVCVAVLCVAAAPAPRREAVELPAAGELRQAQVAVRAAPDRRAKVLRILHQFRPDFRYQIVLAIAARQGRDGLAWLELSLPGRPNGGRGWVRADLVDVHPVRNRITVDRSDRVLEVRSISNDRLLLRTRVAVGKPGAETPLGRSFYVQWRFVPTDPFYGSYALETSAYSRLSDWPGGGIVGIHGTDLPGLLGQAVSHGCIRVRNSQVIRLRRLAPVGTPVDIVR